jgi:ubiquinone/menaquinone biosynthesis C-methylase UbiE
MINDNVTNFVKEISKASKISKEAFFTWFNLDKNTDVSFIRGAWDFSVHIALPLSNYITNPEQKVALEIGHGGGRLLAIASKYFKYVIGIDIHKNNFIVKNELHRIGITNFKLYANNGKSLLVKDSCIDIVYSILVLQHIGKIEIFESYLKEIRRILKPHGLAIIYFGRFHLLSLNKKSELFYFIDRFIERFILYKGFIEIKAKTNDTNLKVSLNYAKKMASGFGFKVLQELVSHKGIPGNIKLYGGQSGLILKVKKPYK